MTGLNASSSMLIGVGFAILTSMIWDNKTGYFFMFGYVLVKYLELDILAIAILGFIVSATIFLIDKKFIDLKKESVNKENNGPVLVDSEEDFFND